MKLRWFAVKCVKTVSISISVIAAATYFLRLQIIILMRGKRSMNSSQVSFLPNIITNIADAFETYSSDKPTSRGKKTSQRLDLNIIIRDRIFM